MSQKEKAPLLLYFGSVSNSQTDCPQWSSFLNDGDHYIKKAGNFEMLQPVLLEPAQKMQAKHQASGME